MKNAPVFLLPCFRPCLSYPAPSFCLREKAVAAQFDVLSVFPGSAINGKPFQTTGHELHGRKRQNSVPMRVKKDRPVFPWLKNSCPNALPVYSGKTVYCDFCLYSSGRKTGAHSVRFSRQKHRWPVRVICPRFPLQTERLSFLRL